MGKPASTEQIREILGDIPSSTVTAIVATGATVEEVAEASAWMSSDDAVGNELRHRCQGRVAEIVDLLTPDDVDDEDFG